MNKEVEPIVRSIEKRFRDLSVSVREERVIRYIVRQLQYGRDFDKILQDAYLLTHTTSIERAELLENPAVIKAIEEEIRHQFAGYRSVARTGTG